MKTTYWLNGNRIGFTEGYYYLAKGDRVVIQPDTYIVKWVCLYADKKELMIHLFQG